MSGGLRHEDDDDKFVIVPRPTIRDSRLSFRARGLLTFILDLPDGWDVKATWLATQGQEGREAVYTALTELRAAGYYRVERRQVEGGRWATGTAVSKVARPSWAAEYAEQEAARLAKRAIEAPVYEQTEIADPITATMTQGDGEDTSTELRVSGDRFTGHRSPDDRSPDDRLPVDHKEERGRRSEKETPSPSERAPEPVDEVDEQRGKRKRRTKLPADWAPTEDQVARAEERAPGINVPEEVERFRDYHLAHGSLMEDWGRAWSTWVGNWARFAARQRPAGGRGRPTPHRNTGSTAESIAAKWDSYRTQPGGAR